MEYSKNLIDDISSSGNVRKLVSRPPRKNEETTKYMKLQKKQKNLGKNKY